MRSLLPFLTAILTACAVPAAAQVRAPAGLHWSSHETGSQLALDARVASLSRPAAPASTTAERFVGGLIVGAITGIAVSTRSSQREHYALGYTLGSAGGVLLATARREQLRPLPVLLGTALGALPLLVAADAERDGPFVLPVLLIGTITTPLLGAAGQRW